ncbi:hypothetical protein BUALT_Bualt14G0036900 [Buddleja alternifolia]|uniref:Late embryogenesis abundant protein n=1 Tax=Buddleja alternifolia TaxID=168488 RepID=A0AAV6WRR7_9LAMI|nr:hypothetical protein BUALT_Bualt14G0036900 [Buddleja alternifolia]
MANQGPNNTYNALQTPGQAQMWRDDNVNQPTDIHNQGQATNFLQETGTQAKNMAQGAVNITRGAAARAANIAHEAADAVKDTIWRDAPDTSTIATTTTTVNRPDTTTDMGGSTYPRKPASGV